MLLRVLLFTLIILPTSFATAKIYQWKDANGVTQFTQTPPPIKAGKKQTEVKVVKQRVNQNSFDLNDRLCGVLSRDKVKGDPLELLRTLRMNIRAWEKSAIKHSNEFKRAVDRGARASGLGHIQSNIDQSTCMVNWAKKKIGQLEPLRVKYLEDLEQAEKEFKAAKIRDNEQGGSHRYEYRKARSKLKDLKRIGKGLL